MNLLNLHWLPGNGHSKGSGRPRARNPNRRANSMRSSSSRTFMPTSCESAGSCSIGRQGRSNRGSAVIQNQARHSADYDWRAFTSVSKPSTVRIWCLPFHCSTRPSAAAATRCFRPPSYSCSVPTTQSWHRTLPRNACFCPSSRSLYREGELAPKIRCQAFDGAAPAHNL